MRTGLRSTEKNSAQSGKMNKKQLEKRSTTLSLLSQRDWLPLSQLISNSLSSTVKSCENSQLLSASAASPHSEFYIFHIIRPKLFGFTLKNLYNFVIVREQSGPKYSSSLSRAISRSMRHTSREKFTYLLYLAAYIVSLEKLAATYVDHSISWVLNWHLYQWCQIGYVLDKYLHWWQIK